MLDGGCAWALHGTPCHLDCLCCLSRAQASARGAECWRGYCRAQDAGGVRRRAGSVTRRVTGAAGGRVGGWVGYRLRRRGGRLVLLVVAGSLCARHSFRLRMGVGGEAGRGAACVTGRGTSILRDGLLKGRPILAPRRALVHVSWRACADADRSRSLEIKMVGIGKGGAGRASGGGSAAGASARGTTRRRGAVRRARAPIWTLAHGGAHFGAHGAVGCPLAPEMMSADDEAAAAAGQMKKIPCR